MRPAQNEFCKLIRAIGAEEGRRDFDVMTDFLELAFRALTGGLMAPDARAENEAAYLKVIGRYRKPEAARKHSQGLAIVVDALEADFRDFLGEPFMEIAGNTFAGQFFTPWDLCRVMAKLTIGPDLFEKAKAGEVVTISDPAVGFGAMTLAMALELREAGIDIARATHFDMIDIDIRCVQGCYIQSTLLGLSADIWWGNTLSSEPMRAGWRTYSAVMHPKPRRQPIATPPPIEAAPTPPAPVAQLSLFEV